MIEKINKYNGNVWMPIISLKRENAARLGYDNAKAWQTLLKSMQPGIAKHFKIPLTDLEWYAAFHDKEDPPHIHMLVYSKSGGGYLSKKGIYEMRKALTKEIFKNDLYQLYDYKTQMRDKLTDKFEEDILNIKNEFSLAVTDEAYKLFDELKKYLRDEHTGKYSYAYLKPEGKVIVDKMFKVIAQSDGIDELYRKWCDIQKNIMGYYQDEEIEFAPLWENNVFYKLKNTIIKEAKDDINPDNTFKNENPVMNLILNLF